MEKTYKYRIYPNKKQKELICRTFGCCRFVYNYFLEKSINDYKQDKISYNYFGACKNLTALKQEKEWLKEPDKCALQNALKDLKDAHQYFFNGKGFPKFKTKKEHRQTYRTSCSNNNIAYYNRKIKLPKLGWVRTRDKQEPLGRIINATIVKAPSGKYYVMICCTDVVFNKYIKTQNNIGIDLGIKHFATLSNGIKINNPKFLNQSLSKLALLQRRMSRKTIGSSNWNKARIKVARQQEKIFNQRKDYLQKISTKLIQQYDVICIENLKISDMLKHGNINMNRNIFDVSWYEFTRELQYKSNWYDKKLVKVDQYFASSQICHCCNTKSSITKNLNVREWVCPNCKTKLDRDINAAINILNEGIKQLV